MAQQAQSANQTDQRMRPETHAWVVLIGFFALFCLAVAAVGYLGWRYYRIATQPIDDLPVHAIVRVHTEAGVAYQPKGRTDLLNPRERCSDNTGTINDICFQLDEGYRIKTLPATGFGPVASIVLPDQSQIDLWAHPNGTDLTLDKYQVSRWSNRRQEVLLSQAAGYARYDVKKNKDYSEVEYIVELANQLTVNLAPGGSYSVNVIVQSGGGAPDVTSEGMPLFAEVAVRSGTAEIIGPNQRATLRPGQLLQIDRDLVLGAPALARWQLVQDGEFHTYSAEEYNHGSDTWSVTTPTKLPPNEQRGTFSVINSCRPQQADLCVRQAERTTIGQFRREGGQQAHFITGIIQPLDVDISEFTRSLHFSAWTRVLTQSVESAGIDGTECPVMIVLRYKKINPNENPLEYTICAYTGKDATITQSYIHYVKMPLFKWQLIDIELRNIPELTDVRYLQDIRIEARGHDYLTEISGISLVGSE